MQTIKEAMSALNAAWPSIKSECLSVLGSELHYQAMIYHCLRQYDVPIDQLGMNVKMMIYDPISPLFKELTEKRHQDFRGGFEPIPDIVIFKPSIKGDWRRRNYEKTLSYMLVAIEVKASERERGRLRPGEIIQDISKLSAHRDEVESKGSTMYPVMIIIDSAPLPKERMTQSGYEESIKAATDSNVGLMYTSPEREYNSIQGE